MKIYMINIDCYTYHVHGVLLFQCIFILSHNLLARNKNVKRFCWFYIQ